MMTKIFWVRQSAKLSYIRDGLTRRSETTYSLLQVSWTYKPQKQEELAKQCPNANTLYDHEMISLTPVYQFITTLIAVLTVGSTLLPVIYMAVVDFELNDEAFTSRKRKKSEGGNAMPITIAHLVAVTGQPTGFLGTPRKCAKKVKRRINGVQK